MPPYTAIQTPVDISAVGTGPHTVDGDVDGEPHDHESAEDSGDREGQPAVVEVDHEQRDAGGHQGERSDGVRRTPNRAPAATKSAPVASSTSG